MKPLIIRTRGIDRQATSHLDVVELLNSGDLDENSVARQNNESAWTSATFFPELHSALENTRNWRRRRDRSSLLNLLGLLSYVPAFLILALQVFLYLKNGSWPGMPLLKYLLRLLDDTSLGQWFHLPQSWFGLHRLITALLSSFSVAGAFALLGMVLILFGAAAEPHSDEWQALLKSASDADMNDFRSTRRTKQEGRTDDQPVRT